MDVVMTVCAWFLLAIAALGFFVAPFLIGKDRGKYTASSYLTGVVESIAIVIVVGRLFEWW